MITLEREVTQSASLQSRLHHDSGHSPLYRKVHHQSCSHPVAQYLCKFQQVESNYYSRNVYKCDWGIESQQLSTPSTSCLVCRQSEVTYTLNVGGALNKQPMQIPRVSPLSWIVFSPRLLKNWAWSHPCKEGWAYTIFEISFQEHQ